MDQELFDYKCMDRLAVDQESVDEMSADVNLWTHYPETHEAIAKERKESIIVTVHKESEKIFFNNYKGIIFSFLLQNTIQYCTI